MLTRIEINWTRNVIFFNFVVQKLRLIVVTGSPIDFENIEQITKEMHADKIHGDAVHLRKLFSFFWSRGSLASRILRKPRTGFLSLKVDFIQREFSS